MGLKLSDFDFFKINPYTANEESLISTPISKLLSIALIIIAFVILG